MYVAVSKISKTSLALRTGHMYSSVHQHIMLRISGGTPNGNVK